jgi:two-component system sensor histidine kinase AlgZ
MISMSQIKGDLLASLLNDRALLAVIIVGQLLAIILTFSPLLHTDPWLTLAPVSLFIHFVSLASLSSIYLLKTQLRKASYHQQLMVLILVICGFTLATSYVVFSLEILENISLIEFLGRNLLIAFIIAVLYAQFSIMHAERSYSEQIATQAQLSSLQARIRPHFLFNSLNMAAELVYHNAEDAEKTILALADLSRAAMHCDEAIPLEKEILLAQQYMLVESWRFGDRLTIDWQLPEQLPELNVPALTIQPLLENAICHGVEPNEIASVVTIQLLVSNSSISLIVDNPYLPNAAKVRPSNGIAVENIKERLQMYFGKRAKLTHFIQSDRFRTKLVIPR